LLSAYRARHRLPHERTHDYLKQMAAVTAAAAGAKNVRLEDYALKYVRDEEADAADNVVVVDFKPRGSRKRSSL
jgi:membrane protein implicated in regulation of membrane protease activity